MLLLLPFVVIVVSAKDVIFLSLLRCCMNCCSGRRRGCAVHNGIKASLSPILQRKFKSTPLSCVSTMHAASRRTPPAQYKHHPPWISCRQCSSMCGSLYRQQEPQPTATTAELGLVMQGQGRLYDVCGCGEDSESGCRLLPDEIYTSRMKLRQSQSLSRSSTQQHHSGSTSPSRTVLLLGAD